MSTITTKVILEARKRGVTVYTRRQWGSKHLATYQWRRLYRKHKLIPRFAVDTVWQHITVTRRSGDFKADARFVEGIGYERFKSGVSYNWLVDMKTGEVALGQALDAAGTHTVNDKEARTPSGAFLSYNQNYVSIAIAVVGMPGDVLSKAAKYAIASLIRAHIAAGVVTKDFDYLPHSWVAWKDCPCDSTRNAMPRIEARAKRGLT